MLPNIHRYIHVREQKCVFYKKKIIREGGSVGVIFNMSSLWEFPLIQTGLKRKDKKSGITYS